MRGRDVFRRVRKAMRRAEAHVAPARSPRARRELAKQAAGWVRQARREVLSSGAALVVALLLLCSAPPALASDAKSGPMRSTRGIAAIAELLNPNGRVAIPEAASAPYTCDGTAWTLGGVFYNTTTDGPQVCRSAGSWLPIPMASGALTAGQAVYVASGGLLASEAALALSRGGTGISTAADDTTLVSSGAAWVASAIPNCAAATEALQYTAATNAFSCGSISAGANTALSNLAAVAINLPLTTGSGIAAALTATVPPVPTDGATAGAAASLTASAAIPNAGAGADGAAAGGSVTITAGAAARDTSGNANGGDVNIIPGAGIGTGTRGVVNLGAAGDTVGATITGLSTAGPLMIVSNTAASGGTDTGFDFDIAGNLASADIAFRVDENGGGSNLFQISGGGTVTAAGDFVTTGNDVVWGGATTGGAAITRATTNDLTLQGGAASATWNDVTGSGTVANKYQFGQAAPTLTASNSVTYSSSSTWYIGGAPIASTNVTIGTPYALLVDAGTIRGKGRIQGEYFTTAADAASTASRFEIGRRDTGAVSWSIFSAAGELAFYDPTATAGNRLTVDAGAAGFVNVLNAGVKSPQYVTTRNPETSAADAVACDFLLGAICDITLADDANPQAITMSNWSDGGKYTILVHQPAAVAANNVTVTWAATGGTVKWPSAVNPVLSTDDGHVDVFSCVVAGTSFYCGASLNYAE